MAQLERAPRPTTHHPAFAWDDPFLLDQQLTEDERMIRDTAREYAREKLLPRVTDAYMNEETDREIFREARSHPLCRKGAALIHEDIPAHSRNPFNERDRYKRSHDR
jgi:Acyl-CoA dehydrogenase, N-terminal domain